MNGNLISKKLGTSWVCPNQELHWCSLRHCEIKRKEYRRLTHLSRKETDNEKNRKRYHEKYKNDAEWMKKRRESWKEFAKKMGPEWQKMRGRKYSKGSYSRLSPSARSKVRKAYTKWAKANWGKRVEYAREYRRKEITFGFRSKIARARRTGDIRKLAEECLAAIIQLDEKGSRGRRKP